VSADRNWRAAEIEAKTQLLAELAKCFDDFGNPEVIEHMAEGQIVQRAFALALGCWRRRDLVQHCVATWPLALSRISAAGDLMPRNPRCPQWSREAPQWLN
jgi:hypothetical protein